MTLTQLVDSSSESQLARRVWNMLSDESYLLLTDVGAALPSYEAALVASRNYFRQLAEAKERDHIRFSDDHRGYVPMGEEGKAGPDADYKESYDCGWQPIRSVVASQSNHLSAMPGFETAVTTLWRQLQQLAEVVASLFSQMLGEDPNYLANRASAAPSQLRLLHYFGDDPNRVGVDWHTDYECFTLLVTTSEGLEVRRPEGSIARVPWQPDSLVVTPGDLTEVLTNGGLKAAAHRVMPLSTERYSMAFFYALNWEAQVEPLPRFIGASGRHYPAFPAGEHLLRRTNEGFAYRRRLQASDSMPEESGASSVHFYQR